MCSFLSQVFGCCLRSRSRSPGGPDERTHLIHPTDEVPPIRSYVVDSQKMKERLGTIVRSKEGKMVNVNAALPFNLHNRALHARPDHSVSARTTPPRPGASNSAAPNSPTDSMHPAAHPRAPSYSPERDPSPSIQTSRSTSSLHPGDASYLPPEADPDSGVHKPILNIRLVRGPGGFTAGGRVRQGRTTTRGRLGRFEEDRGRQGAFQDGGGAPVVVVSESDSKGKQLGSGMGAQGQADASPVTADSVSLQAMRPALSPLSTAESTSPPAEEGGYFSPGEATPHAAAFKIEDVGKISQSWGD